MTKDERTVEIIETLPSPNLYYKIYYSPKSYSEQSVSIYFFEFFNIILDIKSLNNPIKISKEISMDYLKWYKILLTYKSGKFRLFLNGEKIIDHFDEKLVFSNYFGNINIGSNFFGEDIFSGKISSTKISRKANGYEIVGLKEKDINYFDKYSDNEMIKDEYTTYLNNFNFELSLSNNFLK